jgi:hypothetical protein
MSVNLKEFLLKELKFFPFLLQQDHDQVYIATESLYPFLISKERNEVYILQNLLDSNLWEFNFDNSRIYFSKEYLGCLQVLENTFYFQGEIDPQLEYTQLVKYKNYGFVVLKEPLSTITTNTNFLKFNEYHQRILEYKHLKDCSREIPKDIQESAASVKFKQVNSRTNFKVLKKLFSLIAPVNFVFLDNCNTKGIVNFKSEDGKKLALEYFKREFVWQKDGKDLGSLMTDSNTDVFYKRIILEDVGRHEEICMPRKRKAVTHAEEIVNKHVRF